MTFARVKLWGETIGAIAVPSEDDYFAVFEYAPEFVGRGIEPSPFMMPVRQGQTYSFRELPAASFHGLPGMLADCRPDKFGNRVISRWLQSQEKESLSAIERLCYTGSRGMGALEFEPATGPEDNSESLEVDALVSLANSVLSDRKELSADLKDPDAMGQILAVGTSAGGARAKAVIAWNRATDEMRSGQIDHGPDFEHWLMKFDGVDASGDSEGADEQGYGIVEYAYSLMAREAGINMAPCELLHRGNCAHFLTKRFDRVSGNEKLHMQSLAALRHLDFLDAGADSYETAMYTMTRLGLSIDEREQQLSRAVFNVLARNQDDHVKNIAFLMDAQGNWSLSPAYDVTFAFNPEGPWTRRHQMSIGGKLDDFSKEDLLGLARQGNIPKRSALRLFERVAAAVANWPTHAKAAGLEQKRWRAVQKQHRTLQ
ncbi:MAG: type II toxin-antitoxin system HipA family toxin [Nannocystaceae bacterium]